MNKLIIVLGLVIFLPSPLLGIEIESKDGRSFSGSIIDADKTTVTVKQIRGGNEFKLARDNLSIETNHHIDDFLKEKRDAADAKKGKRSTFELTRGNRKYRVSLRLPNPDVPIVPTTTAVSISGEGTNRGNRLDLSFAWDRGPEWAEEEVNLSKQAVLQSASIRVGATAHDIELAKKTLDVTKVQYGKWSGFVLGTWTDADVYKKEGRNPFHTGQRYACFTDGSNAFRVVIATEKSGKFRLDFLPDIVESLSLEEIVEAEE